VPKKIRFLALEPAPASNFVQRIHIVSKPEKFLHDLNLWVELVLFSNIYWDSVHSLIGNCSVLYSVHRPERVTEYM
jgi:hypothetical protein